MSTKINPIQIRAGKANEVLTTVNGVPTWKEVAGAGGNFPPNYTENGFNLGTDLSVAINNPAVSMTNQMKAAWLKSLGLDDLEVEKHHVTELFQVGPNSSVLIRVYKHGYWVWLNYWANMPSYENAPSWDNGYNNVRIPERYVPLHNNFNFAGIVLNGSRGTAGTFLIRSAQHTRVVKAGYAGAGVYALSGFYRARNKN